MNRTTNLVMIAALVLTSAASSTPHANAKARTAVTVTEQSYGPDPLQVVTISRPANPTGKAVLMLHGGGWTTGGRGSVEDTAADYANTGWYVVNASYRLGVLDGVPDDGKRILADAYTVLQFTRSLPGVDPEKVIVYGESAGGHLATWLGAKYGPQVAGVIAFSPVASPAAAATAGQAQGAAANVVALGQKAAEFFSYSYGTTSAHRYLDRVQAAYVVVSTDEWVDPDLQGRPFCAALKARCALVEYPGTAHAGKIADQVPGAALAARHWADKQLPISAK